MRRNRIASFIMALCAVVLGITSLRARSDDSKSPWKLATRDHTWSFPRDHFAHPEYQIEWWYFTGQLRDPATKQRYGYQFTLFRVGLSPELPTGKSAFAANSLAMGHAAITSIGDDSSHGEHRFRDVLWRAATITGGFRPFTGASREIARCPAVAGSAGEWKLDWSPESAASPYGGFDFAMQDDKDGGIAMEMSTRAEKPLAFEGEDGVSSKSASGTSASLYYSFTRMATNGSIVIDGKRCEVVGESWMDHEISSSELSGEQVGWDWFSIQLDDGRDVMLYRMRNKRGEIDFSRGTVVGKDGTTRFLGRDDVVAHAGRVWPSDRTDARYPVEWSIEIKSESLRFEVKPEYDGAENVAPFIEKLHYWEGPISIRTDGKAIGRGYLELTGYGKDARLPL